MEGCLHLGECWVSKANPEGALLAEGCLHLGECWVSGANPEGSLSAKGFLHWGESLKLMGTPNSLAIVPSSVLRT